MSGNITTAHRKNPANSPWPGSFISRLLTLDYLSLEATGVLLLSVNSRTPALTIDVLLLMFNEFVFLTNVKTLSTFILILGCLYGVLTIGRFQELLMVVKNFLTVEKRFAQLRFRVSEVLRFLCRQEPPATN